MFASSPRQASQFIRYGKVKVNGVTIKHPGYLLKAGDVFSCDPERVLQAVGRSKPSVKESVELVNRQIRRYNRYVKKCKKFPEQMFKVRENHKKRHPWLLNKERENLSGKIAETNTKTLKRMNENINAVTPSSILKKILLNENVFDATGNLPNFGFGSDVQGKSLSVFQLATGKRAILTPVEPKEETKKEEAAEVKAAEVKAEEVKAEEPATPVEVAPVDEQKVEELITKILPPKKTDAEGKPIAVNKSELLPHAGDIKKLLLDIVKIRAEQIRVEANKSLIDPANPESYKTPYDPEWVKGLPEEIPLVDAEAAETDLQSVLPVRLPWLAGGLYGLQEPEKPYFTPWAPRPFLSPFAILPHHIEVSFETCHAIYMRDPIARPGHSEVISPFSLDMHERAYMFYVTRRRK